MRIEDFELAAPGKGEVAVQVRFAAINPIDRKVRNGYLKIVTGKGLPICRRSVNGSMWSTTRLP
ncbi:hypothetical protein D083_3529 [Dickeya solani RNS 08.23.3.1.A]|nr:hypothetical protein D083_3529 [Dickeya solani RNS 08.23.3.1.A]